MKQTFPLTTHRRSQPHWHLDLRLPAQNRKTRLFYRATGFVIHCWGSPRKLIQTPSQVNWQSSRELGWKLGPGTSQMWQSEEMAANCLSQLSAHSMNPEHWKQSKSDLTHCPLANQTCTECFGQTSPRPWWSGNLGWHPFACREKWKAQVVSEGEGWIRGHCQPTLSLHSFS